MATGARRRVRGGGASSAVSAPRWQVKVALPWVDNLFKPFVVGERGVTVGRWGRRVSVVSRVPRSPEIVGAMWLDADASSIKLCLAVARYTPRAVHVLDRSRCEVLEVPLPSRSVPCGSLARIVCNEHLLHIVVAATLVAQGLAEDAWTEVRVYGGDIDVVAEAMDGSLAAVEVKPWIRRSGEDYGTVVSEIKDKVYYYGRSGFEKMNLLYASFCGSGRDVVEMACRSLGVNFLEMPGLWIEGKPVFVRLRYFPRSTRRVSLLCGPGFLEWRASR